MQGSVNDRLPAGKTFALGFQHVLVMYAGVVVVPILIGTSLGLTQSQIAHLVSIDLILAGVGTLLQAFGVWKVGIRMPLVVGAASQGVVPVVMVGQEQGLNVVLGSVLVAGVAWFFFAPLFARLVRFFPNVVIGTVILLIGMTLVPVGFKMIAGSDPSDPDFGNPGHLALAGVTLLLMAVFYKVLRGFARQLSVLLAIVIGTTIGWIADPTALSGVGQSAPFAVAAPFSFGHFEFHIPSIIMFLIIVFVLTVEASGQGLAAGEVLDVKVNPGQITRLLRVDALMTTASSFFFGFLYTTFGQNIGLLKLTGVRSRWPVAVGGGILIVLGVVQPVGEVMSAIPQPVVGAAASATFAMLVVSGVQLLREVDLDKPGNMLIVLFGTIAGLIPVASPQFFDRLPENVQIILHSGIATGAIIAVVLNLIFNYRDDQAAARAHGEAQARDDSEDLALRLAPAAVGGHQPPAPDPDAEPEGSDGQAAAKQRK